MKIGDIVFIQGEVRVCVDTAGYNWDFRDLHGGFDYFGKETPYMYLTSEKELKDSITLQAWKAYEDELFIYHAEKERAEYED